MKVIEYADLSPDIILDAMESVGLRAEYSIIPLNSYENRVHLLTLEDGQRIVSKFYRPSRWSDAQILEEHTFSIELAGLDIPVVAPMAIDQQTLFEFQGFRFSVFPAKGGRNIEIENLDNLEWMGRFLARLHQAGSQKSYQHRPEINPITYGQASLEFLQQCDRIPDYLRDSYLGAAQLIVERVEDIWAQVKPQCFRIHGDCHPSNVMWTDSGPHFVDFDDSRNGPAIQDLWMLMSTDAEDMRNQWDALLCGYEEFREFDESEIQLIEPLRGLRMLHYTSWIGQRWSDPSFQHHFSWFDSHRYWEEQTLHLKEQLSLIDNPPLKVISGNG